MTRNPTGSDILRFIALVCPQPDGCWQWKGYINPGGYARFSFNGKASSALRFALSIKEIEIPDGYETDHLCRNRAYVNPDHAEAVTKEENIRRGEWPSAINARKLHCSRGHLFDEANTMIQSTGARMCKTCRSLTNKANRQANPERHRAYGRKNYYKHREKRLEYARKRRG